MALPMRREQVFCCLPLVVLKGIKAVPLLVHLFYFLLPQTSRNDLSTLCFLRGKDTAPQRFLGFSNAHFGVKFESAGNTEEIRHPSNTHLQKQNLPVSPLLPLATQAQSVNESEKSWLPDVLAY